MYGLLSNKVDKEYLIEFGLEKIQEYGFMPTEKEFQILKKYNSKIETDFLGFGNVYAVALKHMNDNLKVKNILDIGCAWGLFSFMFKDYNYVGLEESGYIAQNGFCKYYDHHIFKRGAFPFQSHEADVFLASMSLGYGGEYYKKRGDIKTQELLLKNIAKFNYGYYKGGEEVANIISKKFKKKTLEEGVIFFYK